MTEIQTPNSLVYTLRDYIAGSIGGITQVLIGQPFDTIKVRLQSSVNKISIGECLKDLIRNEGIFAFYKGVASPLICMSGIVSIQFGIFQNSMKMFKEHYKIKELSLPLLAVCGSLSGVGCSIIVGPMEHIRIKMQLMKNKMYKNTIDCAIQIYKQYGVKGLYKGEVSTILREIPGEVAYFVYYELQMRYLRRKYQDSPTILKYSPLFAGGMAGLVFWGVIYPIDTLKSRIQGDSFVEPKYRGLFDAYQKTVKNEGFNSLYKGFTVCAIRSIPVNAFGFLAFEETKKLIERRYTNYHH
ncbi:hypothetical protein ABPG72_006509 [Tetrahymena utriculariae]